MRRRLPSGATVEDYVFQEGPSNLDAGDAPIQTVRLSELFSGPDRSVVIYHLMYGKRQTNRMRNLSTLSVQRSRDCRDKFLSRLT